MPLSISQSDSASLHQDLLQRLGLPEDNVNIGCHIKGEQCRIRRPIADLSRWNLQDLKDNVLCLHTWQTTPVVLLVDLEADDSTKVTLILTLK